MSKYKTIEISEYEKMLKEISITNEIDNDNYDLVIYGSGGQDRKFYTELKNNPKYGMYVNRSARNPWPAPNICNKSTTLARKNPIPKNQTFHFLK